MLKKANKNTKRTNKHTKKHKDKIQIIITTTTNMTMHIKKLKQKQIIIDYRRKTYIKIKCKQGCQ